MQRFGLQLVLIMLVCEASWISALTWCFVEQYFPIPVKKTDEYFGFGHRTRTGNG